MFSRLFSRNNTAPSGIEYIVVGLGNPGKQYDRSRHNAGFEVIDVLAESLGADLKRIKFKGLCAEVCIGSKKALLLKPSTFMNLSGQSVKEAMSFYKVPPENVIVIFDDISLPPGKMRIRRKGSDGGHNGMKNIIYLSGSDAFPRIKIGVGAKPSAEWDLADWVLSKFSDKDYKAIKEAAKNASEAIGLIIEGNIDRAMNLFNS